MKFKYYVLVTCLTFMAAVSAKAAPTENVTLVSRTSILEDSSEHRRMGKDYLLTWQLVGFAVAPIPSAGINLGMYLNRNSIVQLEFSKGTLPYFFFNLNATTIGANYKHFFGNSFYTKLGFDYRSISVSDIDLLYTKQSGPIGETETIVGNAAIGNQWQWQNFTMGCDWIGINPPLAVLSTKHETTSLNDPDNDQLDRSWNNLAKVTSWQFLRFYLGASF